MIVALGSDQTGADTKRRLVCELEALGLEVHDFSPPPQAEGIDYPDPAVLVARAVSSHHADLGVVLEPRVAASGIVGQVEGVRVAFCTAAEDGRRARAEHEANVLWIEGRATSAEAATAIVRAWLASGSASEAWAAFDPDLLSSAPDGQAGSPSPRHPAGQTE